MDGFRVILVFALLSASRQFTVLSILRGFLTVGIEGAEFRGSFIYFPPELSYVRDVTSWEFLKISCRNNEHYRSGGMGRCVVTDLL